MNKRIRKKQQKNINVSENTKKKTIKQKLSNINKKWLLVVVNVIVLVGVIVFVKVSYAYLYQTLRGEKSYSLKVKGFSLKLDDSSTSENIKIENSIPVSDSEGKNTNAYTFSIINEDASDTGYVLYLDDVSIDNEINRMKDTNMKYQLIENGKETVGLVSDLGTNPFRILVSGVIGGNQTNNYSLRFWIKEDAEVAAGQVFNVKIRVIATSKEAIVEGKLVFGDTIVTSDSGVTSMTSDELQNYIDKVSENKIESIIRKHEATNAGYHNSIFRGKDVTSYLDDGSLYERISSGTFEDLYVGDYIFKTNVVWRIAGFDIYLNKGDQGSGLAVHHAVIVPDTSLTTDVMNDTQTAEGGYVGSKMYKEILPNILTTYITPVFGNHVLEYRNYLTNSIDSTCINQTGNINTGCSNEGTWQTRKLDLMNENQVYASKIFSASGFDAGSDTTQFPLFALAPSYVRSNLVYWLRIIASSKTFGCIYHGGIASSYLAVGNLGIRPYFYIG